MYATFTYTFRRYGTRQAAISTFAWLVGSRRWQQGLVLRARWAYVIGLAGTSSQNVFTPETFLGVISFRCSSRCRGFDFHWIYEFPWCLNPWGEEWSQIGMSLGWRPNSFDRIKSDEQRFRWLWWLQVCLNWKERGKVIMGCLKMLMVRWPRVKYTGKVWTISDMTMIWWVSKDQRFIVDQSLVISFLVIASHVPNWLIFDKVFFKRTFFARLNFYPREYIFYNESEGNGIYITQ